MSASNTTPQLATIALAAVVALAVAVACGGRAAEPVAQPEAPEDASEFSPLARKVQALIKPLIDDDWLVGVSIGLIAIEPDNTRRIFYDAGAIADGGPTPSRNTVYEIGSVSKVFTALLLADMAQRREVTLDQPVSALLPAGVTVPRGDGADGAVITLSQLASHTSGLTRLPANLDPMKNPDNPYLGYTDEMLYAAVSSAVLQSPPGQTYAYSNLGAGLLGAALARRAGKPYEAVVTERVLAPLGMTSTAIELSDDLRDQLAPGHDADGRPVSGWDLGALVAAGGWRSTARDMLRFVEANLRLDRPELAPAMRTTHAPRHDVSDGEPGTEGVTRIGLGWHLDPRGVWNHNGQTGGYHSYVAFWPDRGLGVVVLSNTAAGVVDKLGESVVSLLAGQPYALNLPPTLRLSPEVLARYAGRYQLEPGFSLEFTVDGGEPYVQATGQPRFRVYASSETGFYWRVVPATIEFQVDAAGAVAGATFKQGGATAQARRID